MGSPIISQQKIIAASQGDANALRDVLNQLSTTTATTESVIGTTPTAAPIAGQPSPAAPIPPQATGTVSVLANNYIVQIVNPGASSAVSQLQAAQAAGNATFLTPLQPVKAIYHQIRASTSPAFNVNSNTQMFGGNTGSAQVYWSLTGLGTGTWYFQFRSSYDGVNFNTWKNVNGGAALGGLINQVTEENVGDVNWALFAMPGGLIAGIGEGLCANGALFELASQLYSSGLFALASPNGAPYLTTGTYGVTASDVDLQTPTTGTAGVVGIPDFPVEISVGYGIHGASPSYMPGVATVFGIAIDPSNENVTLYPENGGTPTTDASWAVVQLPGGAKIAIGQGLSNHGDTIWTPAGLTWISGANMMSVSSFTGATDIGFGPDGFLSNSINTSFVLSAQYTDTNADVWNTQANWLMICWQAGSPTLTAGGNTFLVINLQGGHAIIIGTGTGASGTAITLPAGYTEENMLGIVVPNGGIVNPSNHNLSGIVRCAFNGLIPILNYGDTSGNIWTGNVDWMVAAWI